MEIIELSIAYIKILLIAYIIMLSPLYYILKHILKHFDYIRLLLIMETIAYITMLSPLYYILKHFDYIQLLYDNKVYYNLTINNYIRKYHINKLSSVMKEYIYGSLYELTTYDDFFCKQIKIINNQRLLLPYSEQIKSIELYKKYPLLYNNLYVNIELSNCDINDRQQKINDFYNNKIITEKQKNKLLFTFCNIIDITTFSGYIVNEILQNKNNDYYVYNNIKNDYKNKTDKYQLYNLLNISKDEIDIIIEYNYILFINYIFGHFDYKHCNRYMYELQKLIDITYNYTSLKNIHNNLLLNNYVYIYNNFKYNDIANKIYDIQLEKFNNYKDFNSFLDILITLYKTNNINDLTIFIKNNLDYLKLLKNYKSINKIITIILYIIQKSNNKYIIFQLKNIFFNECQIHFGKQNNICLVIQNPDAITRTVYDNSEKSVCLICLDEYNNHKVVLCTNCNKYICHYICFKKMINKKCLYCNKF